MTTIEDATARPLPSGVLTFLFTDVVDSTALWERAPGLMDATLSRHDLLIERAVVAHGGFLLKHRGEGDSTFCVFAQASDAIAAAIRAQRDIAAETWDPATPIHVRMGLHSGESIIRGRDYYGQTINRAARVRAVAGGGQVLLSSRAAELVDGDLPDDTEVRFLRQEVLRGIDKVEAIHELVDLTRSRAEEDEATGSEQPPLQPEIDAGVSRFFGERDDALAAIASARTRAENDRIPQLVFVDGVPGIGKTNIACASAQVAHGEGWTALLGTCAEHVHAPFEPFREMLDHFVETAPMHVLASHITEHGGEIGRLTSKLASRVGALPPVDALDPETTRQLLIGAVTDVFQRAADARPTLLMLDGVQWADRSTLAVLDRLARSGGHPLVVLCTNETGESGAGDASPLLADLRALQHTSVIEVRPFGEAEVVVVLENAIGHELDDDGRNLVSHLVEETGGNPMFVVELVRYYVAIGVIRSDDHGRMKVDVPPSTVPTPPNVKAVIQQRVARLGDDTKRILGAASVAGRSFDTEVLAGVLHVDEVDLLDALESATAATILREVAMGTFEFSNPFARQTVYDDLGATRRGLWHRSLAESLESRVGESNPALVAYHWTSTGRDDRHKVAEWAHRAGTAALTDLAPETAVRWLRTALESVTDDNDRLDILIDLGDAQRWAEADAFRQTLLDAAALAEELGDDDALIRAALANNRGGASRAGEVDIERVVVIERALERCGEGDSPERARLLATLAIELSQGADLERRTTVSDEALAIARRVGDDLTLVRVLLLTLEANRVPANLEQRKADTDQLLTLATQLGDPVVIAVAAMRSLRVKIEAADFAEADGIVTILEEYAKFDPYALNGSMSARAALAHARGQLDTATELADEAFEVSRSESDAKAIHLSTTAIVKRDRGELADLVPTLEYIVENHPGITGFRPQLGMAYLQAGRRDDAAALLQRDIDNQLADYPMNPLWMASVSMVALLAIDLDNVEAAEMLYPTLAPWRGRGATSVVSYNGLVTELLGLLALTMGDLDRAESDLDEAIEQAERIGALGSLACSRYGRAQIFAARGATAEAAALAGRAAADAERLGMTVVANAAGELAVRLGGGDDGRLDNPSRRQEQHG
ncbi:MAG: AAA family ATPase [Acidimicrobiia bacterium]|nr:AAA family ATPase [Acidimicrobiia bacterium]